MSQTNHTEKKMKTRKPRSKWRKFIYGFLLLVSVIVFAAWMYLPKIAERVILKMIADAGLDETELRVVEIGWSHAILEDISMADENWKIDLNRVELSYAPLDLAKGKTKDIALYGLKLELDLDADPEPKNSDEPSALASIHQLPSALDAVDTITIDQAEITLVRGSQRLTRILDIQLDHSRSGEIQTALKTSDFQLSFTQTTSDQSSHIQFLLDTDQTTSFLSMIRFLIDSEESIIPDGLEFDTAALSGNFTVEEGVIPGIQITGELGNVVYQVGSSITTKAAQKVAMKLSIDSDGLGSLDFSGKLATLDLDFNPATKLALHQAPDQQAGWNLNIHWGSDHDGITGTVDGLSLSGNYQGKEITLDTETSQALHFNRHGDTITLKGVLSNNSVKLPFSATCDFISESEIDWQLDGGLELGPINHNKPLPLLIAVSSLFEDIEITGNAQTQTRFTFSAGSESPFEGKLVTRIRNAQIKVSDGKAIAKGVNGEFKLHMPASNNDETIDSIYSLELTAESLTIDTNEALGYPLKHPKDQPIKITLGGSFNDDTSLLQGSLTGLNLYGEKHGKTIQLADTRLGFHLIGETLRAAGVTHLGENAIPFTYQHKRNVNADDWDLDGTLVIQNADLQYPIDNGDMITDALEDISLSGMVSMRMDFQLGKTSDFTASLSATLRKGTIEFADDGPLLEEVKTGIHLASLDTPYSKQFYTFTAKKVTAFDTELTNVRVDYQLLKHGGTKLKNIRMNSLGGVIWINPFTLPDGEQDYSFTVNMRNLDISKLATVFPSFNGDISGRIDGILPLNSKDGIILPGKGNMYLTRNIKAKLKYDVANSFSAAFKKGTQEYERMRMLEESLKNLDLNLLNIRLFHPADKNKAIVIRLEGKAPSVPGSPPIILNINAFQPDDDTVDFFHLLLKQRDKIDFGL